MKNRTGRAKRISAVIAAAAASLLFLFAASSSSAIPAFADLPPSDGIADCGVFETVSAFSPAPDYPEDFEYGAFDSDDLEDLRLSEEALSHRGLSGFGAEKWKKTILYAALAGLVAALITAFSLTASKDALMKTANPQAAAEAYRSDALQLSASDDHLIDSNVVKERRPTPQSNRPGGGSPGRFYH